MIRSNTAPALFFITSLWLFTALPCLAQQLQQANWYFGAQAGLRFTTSPPSLLLDGQSSNLQSATMSDAQGNLLFYFDGRDLYNRQHQIMQNGMTVFDYNGGSPGFMKNLVVQKPGSPHLYYLFTTVRGGIQPISYLNKIYYTLIDMSLANGLGGGGARPKSDIAEG